MACKEMYVPVVLLPYAISPSLKRKIGILVWGMKKISYNLDTMEKNTFANKARFKNYSMLQKFNPIGFVKI